MDARGLPTRLRRSVVQHQLLQRPLWVGARLAVLRGRLVEGATTVVIVNWNSWPYLRVGLDALSRFSDDAVRVLVVDNASSDETRSMLRARPGVRVVALPRNVGHGTALDIGFLLARTEFVVSLDVDAFPIAAGWIDRLLEPLDRGHAVSGAHVTGGFVHPCCLAMRLGDFVTRRHTFTPRYTASLPQCADDVDSPAWDVGQKISLRERKRFLFERTGTLGPGDIGSYWDGLIYHNFYSTRFGSNVPPTEEEVARGVSPQRALDAWDRALNDFLGSTGPDR